ncbi:MBOAT family protein [Adlercreutzia sp. ZJ138]|uniref:MBOAT family O-acyltransferase n=1 Tax=Adlercreutzia sp. ZJ138 TaxID=2709405 RepID=UPI0013E9F667|nr:MBOAT family O-acyltransferase [Adlercreutzia sp. ZJ138]
MVFSSLVFLCVFLPVVFAVVFVLPGVRLKNVALIVASLLFYAYGEPVYVLLMLVSATINWLLGLRVAPSCSDAPHLKRHKVVLGLAVSLNLLFLGVFKYAGMLVGSLNAVIGTSIPVPDIALPIGISFYTFQAMSYVVDAYRGEVKPQRNFLNVLLYIAFFPQLIAGPIIKYHDIESQLTERSITLEGVAYGFRRFCVGLAKKVLIANTMAVTADAVFTASFDEINIAVAWIGALAYLFQIYFDFSGYSDMAIGLAHMFGFTYKENFQYPYSSTTIKEFWRRWHISLSTWFKEYLYIPLGGNRKGRLRASVNKIIVFLCCGLWHGAAWTFVLWGAIHGLFLLVEEFVPIKKLPKPIGWAYTMVVVVFAFVLFRADTIQQGFFMMQQMLLGFHFEPAAMALALRQMTPLFFVTFAVACIAALPVKNELERIVVSHGGQVAFECISFVLCFVLLVLCVLSLSGGGYNPFIYFRF